MTRDHVKSVVVKHLVGTVDGLKAEDIDTSRSMKDYGANSLDMVEIVSSAMREIKVKVPRNELAKLTTLDGLIDMLHAKATESAQSTAS
jgi:acyl carrier protein